MSTISTHVLDAVLGKPAAGILLHLELQTDTGWVIAGRWITDTDGRCRGLLTNASEGFYRLTFRVAEYFESKLRSSIYPEIAIAFRADGIQNYHLPLLLSDNSYTTYRGS